MRGGLALAGGADADVTRLGVKLREIRRAEVTHAALDAANELRQHPVHRAASFLERLDAFGRDLLRRILLMAVTRRRAGLHRRQAAHAAVFLVKFAADFDDIAGRLVAAGKNA